MIKVSPYTNGMLITEPGVYSGVPMSAYHGPKLVDGPRISSSGLRRIFSQSPMDYWIESPLNIVRILQTDTEAFRLGRAVHHICLGEAEFGKFFAIRPAKWDSWRTADAKQWRAEKQLEGITVLDDAEVDLVKGMAGIMDWQVGLTDSGIANCHFVIDNHLLNGRIEHSILWRDAETSVWLGVRPDAIPTSDRVASDLKTTPSVDTVSIGRTFNDFRYDMQAALIRAGLRIVCDIDLEAFCFIFVKKKPPHSVQVIEVRADAMDSADADLRTSIRTFADCVRRNRWPGPGGTQSDGRPLGLTSWARAAADNRRAFLEQELAA
jgi:hypothetical protein